MIKRKKRIFPGVLDKGNSVLYNVMTRGMEVCAYEFYGYDENEKSKYTNKRR